MVFRIFLLLITFFRFTSLQSAPIYASKWIGNGQTICLYGDQHNSRKLFNRDHDLRMTKKFIQNLKTLNNDILVLLEDFNTLDNAIYDEIYSTDSNSFISLINLILRTIKMDHVALKNIDTREEFILFHSILEGYDIYLKSKDEAIRSKIFSVFEKAYEYQRIENISEILSQPIDTIKNLSLNCSNDKVKVILENIINSIINRKKFLWEIFKAIGFSDAELSTLSIFDLLNNCSISTKLTNKKLHEKYSKMFEMFLVPGAFSSDYDLEVVEANALWNIIENLNKNIVVIAGAEHIINLEQYLYLVGYSKVDESDPGNYKMLYRKRRLGDQILKNGIQTNNFLPIIEKDIFMVRLNYQFYEKPYPSDAHKFMDSLNNDVKLVSTKTFNWIRSN